MQIEISNASASEPVVLLNEGFWVVGVKQGEKYNLRFYLRTDGSYKGTVTAKIVSANGKVLTQIKYTYVPLVKHYAIAGLNESKNEILIKVVNGESTALKTKFNLKGAATIYPIGEIETLSYLSAADENTFEQPLKIAPKTKNYQGFSRSFEMEFEPYSLNILRIKKGN